MYIHGDVSIIIYRVVEVNLASDGGDCVESGCGRGVAQFGSAPALGAGGRWFESSRPDHLLFQQLIPGAPDGLEGFIPVVFKSSQSGPLPH